MLRNFEHIIGYTSTSHQFVVVCKTMKKNFFIDRNSDFWYDEIQPDRGLC